MLVDANLLLYAVDERSPHHPVSCDWLTSPLNGERRVALPWLSLTAFLGISTNPRASEAPLAASEAWELVTNWLSYDLTWIPKPMNRHADVLGTLIQRYDLHANMVTDAQLAALAIERRPPLLLSGHRCRSLFRDRFRQPPRVRRRPVAWQWELQRDFEAGDRVGKMKRTIGSGGRRSRVIALRDRRSRKDARGALAASCEGDVEILHTDGLTTPKTSRVRGLDR